MQAERIESDRQVNQGAFRKFIRRPEIGAFSGMVVILLLLAIVAGDVVFNPLGIKNNLSIISQLGIIAIGACLLMIAGEFDLSIGSMIGFAGMSMAMMLKWGLPFGLGEASPFMAFTLTLCMTLFIGWIIGNIVVRSGLSSFIVTLAFLFILRGLTEVSFVNSMKVQPRYPGCLISRKPISLPTCSEVKPSNGHSPCFMKWDTT